MNRIFDRRVLLAALLAVFSLVFTTQNADAGSDVHPHPGLIVGLVQTPGGHPVPRARVLVVDADTQQPVFRTLTSQQGRFRTRLLRPGRYLVFARHPIAGQGRAPALVEPGQITPVRIVVE